MKAHTRPNPSPIVTSVPTTAIIAVKTVMVLTLQPNGRARSSHLSLYPRGQIASELIGPRIGRRERLGTQAEDWIWSVGKLDHGDI